MKEKVTTLTKVLQIFIDAYYLRNLWVHSYVDNSSFKGKKQRCKNKIFTKKQNFSDKSQ